MAIFYTLEQVLTHIGDKKEFSDGDTFVFVFDGMVFRNKWINGRNSFENYSMGDSSIYRIFRSKFFHSDNECRDFITPLLTRSYYSTYNLFDAYSVSDCTRIIVKLFELYDTMRSKNYCNSRGVKLSTKFYGENAYAKKSKIYEFGDGTVCLYQDIGRYIGSEESTPLFAMEYFYNHRGTTYYPILRPSQIQYSINGVYNYIIRELITENSGLIDVKGKVYDKKDFFKNVGGLCDITGQYYIGKKERKLSSAGGLKGYHSDQENVIVKASGGNMFFGIELERAEVVDIDYDKAAEDGWRCERDGSVSAEYISPVLSLDNIEESVQFIKDTSQGILDAKISGNCGGHIHVSVKGVDSGLLWRKLAVFMPLMWAIYPERASNGYSRRPPERYSAYDQVERRDLVYKPHIGTVEFRIFPGCRGEKMLRFRLRLLNLIVKKALEFDDKATFQDALNFILTSDEMFSMLSYVYNSADKMQGIAERISDCYRSVEKLSADMDIQATLLLSVEQFVKSKSIPMNRSGVISESI